MRAVLRRLHSPDVDDLPRYCPNPPDVFGFLLQVFAGPEGGEGEESFDFVVCTPKWLERENPRSAIVPGRYHLLLFEYDYDRLYREIQALCMAAQGETWHKVATQLSRFGKWEFEDYVA